jgi:sugar O-acyltransferase (sialic acid O-acetyltransferase NeuD family)
VFWGATGHAKVLRECIRHDGYELAALFDNNRDVKPPFADVPLFFGQEGFLRWRAGLPSGESFGCLAAIGGERGSDRLEIQAYLQEQGLTPIVARHPTAFVASGTRLGPGAQILAHATVCVDVEIGAACIVNTAASVDHECRLGDGVHVGPGARLAGCVTVERLAMVGTGASVLPWLRIGEGAVVGGGAAVIRDVEPYTVVAGNPAVVVGSRPPR